MNRIVPYLGTAAAATLVAGIVLWVFQPERDRIWASLLIAGLILGVFYLGVHWKEVMAALGRRSARYGANLAMLVVVVAGILGAVNYLANRHNKRWDFTATKQFTLSDQTVKILANLKQDLNIVLFQRKEEAKAALDLLDQYKYQGKRLTVEVVDQEQQPARAAKYKTATEANIPFGTVIIDSGTKTERVTSVTEQEVTNALIKVLKEGKKKVYFIEGHGERATGESSPSGLSIIKTKLEESNYEVLPFHPLQAMKESKIELPADAGAIVIAGPQRDYLAPEIDALRAFMVKGGKLVLLLDPETRGRETPALDALVTEWGVELGKNVVIDASGVGQIFGFGPEVPLATSYGSHAITEKFGNVATVYPIVRTVESTTTKSGISVTNLLSTSDASWAETNMKDLETGRVAPDAEDKKGPLHLGVALTMDVEKPAPADGAADKKPEEAPTAPKARAVIVGDSDFIVNSLAGSPIGNRDLFLNMVSWVAEDEDLIAIRPREAEDRRVEFQNAQQQTNVAWLSLVVIPGLFVLLGTYVWWERR